MCTHTASILAHHTSSFDRLSRQKNVADCCSASYKNKENVDLSKVPILARSESDVGSSEVQIARLSARVVQISLHLKTNRKDYSGQRGLQMVLAQRKKLLQYLYKSNRCVGTHGGAERSHCRANHDELSSQS
jgi:ribosomal protein S15